MNIAIPIVSQNPIDKEARCETNVCIFFFFSDCFNKHNLLLLWSSSPPHDDFSPSSLQKITDDIYISLFDEVVVDILRDDRQRETNIHHRIEKKWLGSFVIPFSTLHERERVSCLIEQHSIIHYISLVASHSFSMRIQKNVGAW